jgi:hypothetical protein
MLCSNVFRTQLQFPTVQKRGVRRPAGRTSFILHLFTTRFQSTPRPQRIVQSAPPSPATERYAESAEQNSEKKSSPIGNKQSINVRRQQLEFPRTMTSGNFTAGRLMTNRLSNTASNVHHSMSFSYQAIVHIYIHIHILYIYTSMIVPRQYRILDQRLYAPKTTHCPRVITTNIHNET